MRQHMVRGLGAVLAVIILLALMGVGDAAPAPRRGGTLVVGANSECLKLDPHTTFEISCRTMIGRHVYNGLVKFNDKMEIVPDLAERWTVSEDGRVLTFALRSGVKFHNGDEFTAADVKVSLDRIKEARLASPLRPSFQGVTAVEVVNPQTVRVRLERPDAAFLTVLAAPQMAMLPAAVLRREGDMNNTVIGTGPFRLQSRRKDVSTVLVRNPDYFERGKPYLDQIEFRIVTDDTARSVALRTNRVQFIDRVTVELAEILKRIPGLVIVGGPSLNFRAAVPNLTRRPWNDARVRQAFAIGVDRKAIIDQVLGGRGEPLTGGPIPANLWAGLDQPCYPRPDPARARELLAQAGFPNGFTAGLMSFGEITLLSDTAIALREQALRFGVTLNLELLELGIVQARRARGDFDLVIGGFAGVDPDEWLRRTFYSGANSNFQKYSDPQFDQLLDRALTVQDQAQRRALYHQAQRRLCEQNPMFWLYSGHEQFAMRPEVKGYAFRANNEHNFIDVWFDQ
jgi:peptide/nickel transport system substrate-binding protein